MEKGGCHCSVWCNNKALICTIGKYACMNTTESKNEESKQGISSAKWYIIYVWFKEKELPSCKTPVELTNIILVQTQSSQ